MHGFGAGLSDLVHTLAYTTPNSHNDNQQPSKQYQNQHLLDTYLSVGPHFSPNYITVITILHYFGLFVNFPTWQYEDLGEIWAKISWLGWSKLPLCPLCKRLGNTI